MKIIPFIYDDYDDLYANTYLLIDTDNNCIIIDPSRDYNGIVEYIKKNNLNPKAILLTHGHFDHMRGINTLVNNFNIPIYIGFYDEEALKNTKKNLSYLMSRELLVINHKPITVSDKQILHLLNEPIEVIETPFHTMGSVCYYLKDSKMLFSGDTLFKNSIGRDDLPFSNPKLKRESLNKIMSLPEELKIYPGHGSFTSISEEKKHNPFVK